VWQRDIVHVGRRLSHCLQSQAQASCPLSLCPPAPEPNSNGRPDLRLPSKIPLNAILDAAVCLSYIHRAPRRLCLWLSFSLYTHLTQQSSSSQQLAIKSTTTTSTDSDISSHLRLQSPSTTSITTPAFGRSYNIDNQPANQHQHTHHVYLPTTSRQAATSASTKRDEH
jgi:hypothetical protein